MPISLHCALAATRALSGSNYADRHTNRTIDVASEKTSIEDISERGKNDVVGMHSFSPLSCELLQPSFQV